MSCFGIRAYISTLRVHVKALIDRTTSKELSSRSSTVLTTVIVSLHDPFMGHRTVTFLRGCRTCFDLMGHRKGVVAVLPPLLMAFNGHGGETLNPPDALPLSLGVCQARKILYPATFR